MDREEMLNQLNLGFQTAFIDGRTDSNLAYKPQFLSNDYKKGQKLLSTLEEELLCCDEFAISVAFITMGGITPLLQTLKELERRGIRGNILTTDYLTFSEPKALDLLDSLSNIELRLYRSEKEVGFHTKGYIFKKDEFYHIIIGSSNMTQKALTVNQEWNTKLVSAEQGEMAGQIISEFEALWNSKETLPYDLIKDDYRARFETVKRQRSVIRQDELASFEAYRLEPNSMQVGFIKNLKKLVERGAKKGLLISATGTGKTYASAFGIRDALHPSGKVLFVVHRKEILKQALISYKRVFGSSAKMALLTGDDQNYDEIKDADFVFAIINMISKDEIMHRFRKDEFSVLCLDEVHHGTAPSYQKIMNYFSPRFMLGMTATPDRTDNGNVYELFDYNIAYEIRLQQALENNLLCPFHYFGIKDIAFDDDVSADDMIKKVEKGDLSVFNLLTRDERVKYVLDQTRYYGYCGDRVKGLMFCSSVEEAIALSQKFNEKGLRTLALTGSNNSEERLDAIDRLTSDDRDDYLHYIISVDIFNEGVDIPDINQVVMLRPTESAIIFVQQLGRGLRKAKDKEYVVILDFIGNYSNNFLIPIALSGDRTYNKDNMRKYLMEGSRVIPGASTMHFDEVSKKQIFDAIDRARTKSEFLKEKYFNFKNKLGRVPTAEEFYKYGEIDPILFIEYKKASYYEYVRSVDRDANIPEFTAKQNNTLDFICTQIVNGKRPHELEMIQLLWERHVVNFDSTAERLRSYGRSLRKVDYDSAVRVLRKDFINSPGDKAKYGGVEIVEGDSETSVKTEMFTNLTLDTNQKAFEDAVKDLVAFGLARYEDYYKDADDDNLVLYQKYSRKDVCRILNWKKDDSSTVYGYRIKYNTCPIFVTYEKKDDISATTKYKDMFIDNQVFSWMTRSRVSEDSTEAQQIINYRKNELKLYLFIKKSDDEGADFYYMGRVRPVAYKQTTIDDGNGNDLPIMNFKLKLNTAVRNDIYEYITK